MDARSFQRRLQLALHDSSLLRCRQRARAAFSPGLSFGRHFGPPLPTARLAAVMLLIEINPKKDWREWTIPLTVRSDRLPSHPGQISLPGGRLETPESLQQAAVREFEEELGFDAFPGQVLGHLQSLYIYNSDYFVTPFVAWSKKLLPCVPCLLEVARVLHLPLGVLVDEHAHEEAMFSRGLANWNAPVIRFENDRIWGATAIILGELAGLLTRMDRGAGDSHCG